MRHHAPIAVSFVIGVTAALAGDLDPPAAPAPTAGPEPRIEINATNTPGDADSIHRIAQPGSYHLAGNLTGENQRSGIEIAASGVTLDLMGFDLSGVTGSLDGIVAATGLVDITIRGGTVRGWGDEGIDLVNAANIRLHDLTASGNGGNGIEAGIGTTVTNCLTHENTLSGIRVVAQGLVTGCQSRANQTSGISSGSTSGVRDCVAAGNGSLGITVGNASLVTGCVVVGNTASGIQLSNGGTAEGNLCRQNGLDAGDGAGIVASGANNRIDGNTVQFNDQGIRAIGVSNIVIRNIAASNTVNFDLIADNIVGPISVAPLSSAISGSTGGAGLGTANPWANIVF